MCSVRQRCLLQSHYYNKVEALRGVSRSLGHWVCVLAYTNQVNLVVSDHEHVAFIGTARKDRAISVATINTKHQLACGSADGEANTFRLTVSTYAEQTDQLNY